MAVTEEQQPQFPHYSQPAQPFADPKQSGKLFKMVRFLMKPKARMKLPKHSKSGKPKHKIKFF